MSQTATQNTSFLEKITKPFSLPNPFRSSRKEHGSQRTHLQDQPLFDYAKAHPFFWELYYTEGGKTYCAVGKTDWMPLSVACANLTAHPLRLIAQHFQHAINLSPQSSRFSDWIAANQNALLDMKDNQSLDIDRPVLEESYGEDFCYNVFASMHAKEVGYFFEELITRAFPTVSDDFPRSLAGELMGEHPLLQNMRRQTELALAQFMKNVSVWFELRGFEIDASMQLIKVEGYQPLFIVE